MVLLEGKKMQNRGGVCHVLILFFLFFFKFIFFFCRNNDWREQNTGRFTNIVSGCGFLFFFPLTHRADFSQSCHCCSVSLHWITTSTVTTGEFRNLHLPSRFLKGGTLSQIWVLAALYHSIFIFLVPLFNRLCFFLTVRCVATIRCLQYK